MGGGGRRGPRGPGRPGGGGGAGVEAGGKKPGGVSGGIGRIFLRGVIRAQGETVQKSERGEKTRLRGVM